MAILDLLVAIALLLWGSRQMDRGLREMARPWTAALLPHARRGRYTAFGLGFVAGLLRPAARDRLKWASPDAATPALAPARSLALLLGATFGTATALSLVLQAPAWSFHVLTLAGVAASLLARRPRLRQAGVALFGAGLVLLALQILGLALHVGTPSPVGQAIAQGLAQDALLCVTAGALLALGLRALFPAVLVVALAWGAWLQPQAAVAMLLGVHVGAAVLACTGNDGDAAANRLGAAQLLATLATAATCLLLRQDLAQLLSDGSGSALLLLNLGVQGFTALAFLNLSGPLMRFVQRWLPPAGDMPGAPAAAAARLQQGDLEMPSLALAAALREAMRVADLVDRMLHLSRDVFLRDDEVATQAIRDAEQRVNALYRALKDYLAQIPRRPLNATERVRWEELMAFLIAVEQVADRVARMLSDLEARRASPRRAYPAADEADVLALHEELTRNLRLAASVCLERREAAATQLLQARETFRQAERGFRAAHVQRLVAGEQASVAVSSLQLNLLADFVDMNDQLCAFARCFLELRTVPAAAHETPSPFTGVLTMKKISRGALPQGGP